MDVYPSSGKNFFLFLWFKFKFKIQLNSRGPVPPTYFFSMTSMPQRKREHTHKKYQLKQSQVQLGLIKGCSTLNVQLTCGQLPCNALEWIVQKLQTDQQSAQPPMVATYLNLKRLQRQVRHCCSINGIQSDWIYFACTHSSDADNKLFKQ